MLPQSRNIDFEVKTSKSGTWTVLQVTIIELEFKHFKSNLYLNANIYKSVEKNNSV